ncbi:MAG: type III-A CRISPR-associated RAMP protein Csm5 [Coriobacteriales bacterium]|jgi:CRISPR type III-A-associated RAMP protein Csm5|nr:type III-A CRISPR-associated RAMP protein Csm5 [Coriobacteriales bacterium]
MVTKTYKLTLTTLGPVHIGNGNTIGKKDYFKSGDKISVLNPAVFTAQLNDEQIGEYCEFLQNDSATGLQEFLDKHQLNNLAAKASAYQLDASLARARRGTYQYFEVSEHIKDAYGCPYVPGSSLKGMLRTALLAKTISDENNKFIKHYNSEMVVNRREQKNACKELEKVAFWTERPDPSDKKIVNDVLKYLFVADSKPLHVSELVFVKKYDKFAKTDDGKHKHDMGDLTDRKGNELNIYRECLRPGTKIEFILSIDERLGFDIDYLVAALQEFQDTYDKCFSSHFDSVAAEEKGAAEDIAANKCAGIAKSGPLVGHQCRKRPMAGSRFCEDHQDQEAEISARTEVICHIGGGVDFVTKTVLGALFKNDKKRLEETSKILYSQFPTKIDKNIYGGLWEIVTMTGFTPKYMQAYMRGEKLKKGKDDHRHWKDFQLGVSPHTLKMGKIANSYYEMGKCAIAIEEISYND